MSFFACLYDSMGAHSVKGFRGITGTPYGLPPIIPRPLTTLRSHAAGHDKQKSCCTGTLQIVSSCLLLVPVDFSNTNF